CALACSSGSKVARAYACCGAASSGKRPERAILAHRRPQTVGGDAFYPPQARRPPIFRPSVGWAMGTLTLSQRWPPIKLAALAAGSAPAVWLAALAVTGGLGARPIKAAIN